MPNERVKRLDVPKLGCDYMGQDFGAWYPDSVCIEGFLWDADSGDAAPGGGWNYTVGGEIPCPRCNIKAAAKYAEKPIRKIREYASAMEKKWGTFGNPASVTAAARR